MKYYAVRAGRAPGIYESWTDCKEQTAGYPGAIFKSFTDREAAEQYMQAARVLRTPIKENPQKLKKGGRNHENTNIH